MTQYILQWHDEEKNTTNTVFHADELKALKERSQLRRQGNKVKLTQRLIEYPEPRVTNVIY